VAVSINRVEREFILVSAAQAKSEARLRASGRSLKCLVSSAGDGSISFSTATVPPHFALRELVSVCFDFRGQAIAFDAPVIKATSNGLVLGLPESMYRSLSRRCARVCPPKGLTVDFLLADSSLRLNCPESEEWVEVELPELQEGLDSRDLVSLVDSFKAKAKSMASEGRVVMYKDKGPSDVAEKMAARMGKVLYVPSAFEALPLTDPYSGGRIVTRDMAGEYEASAVATSSPTLTTGSQLSSYLRGRAIKGFSSALWCPVVYYRYTIGMVLMSNGADRPFSLDFSAVDLAWEFSRILAWFLKRYGYFASSDSEVATSTLHRGGIVDASPSGLLAELPVGSLSIEQGTVIRLRLGLKDRSLVCSGKIARRYNEGGISFCGIAFMDLSAQDRAFLSRELYGEAEDEQAERGV
jgi:hypothetical protein